ncbi:unnamed protein product [Nesidiocoris tenuis]|uniref:Uncharacterized protein n=1 Tax=Nesidiocoris tenuis TaxID=355587 RepID=A0A6H5G8H6_9HEMI|nr:unnamed protein product [Nesidiocoris tenuis]
MSSRISPLLSYGSLGPPRYDSDRDGLPCMIEGNVTDLIISFHAQKVTPPTLSLNIPQPPPATPAHFSTYRTHNSRLGLHRTWRACSHRNIYVESCKSNVSKVTRAVVTSSSGAQCMNFGISEEIRINSQGKNFLPGFDMS